MDQGERLVKRKNPRESASIFSIVTFWFTLPVLKKGLKGGIQEKDIYQVLPKYESKILGDKLEIEWYKDCKLHDKPSILRCLLKCFGKWYLFLGIIQLFMRVAMTLLLPYAMAGFVACFQSGQTKLTKADAYRYAAMLISIKLLEVIYNHNYMQCLMEFTMTIKTSLSSLIYRKALRLSPNASMDTFTVGKVVTLITKDVYAVDNAFRFVNDMWIGLVQVGIVTYILYKSVGYPVFVGIGFFFLVVVIQVLCGRVASISRLKMAKKTEERIQLVKEALEAIKIIKMYTWEKYFEKLINAARMKETSKLKIIYYMKITIVTLGSVTTTIAVYLIIVIHASLDRPSTAKLVYFIQQNIFSLKSCITISFPIGISYLADCLAALKRIQAFLTADESIPKDNGKTPAAKARVYLSKVSMHINDKEVLKSVSLEISHGLLIVAGSMGSGKSSLLKTLLKEYPISSGEMVVRGSISYAPEEPWLFPSTIKQNIIFGQPYDEKRYQEVLNVCALTADLNHFEKLDNTIIGDKGVNLSKGQQARISLARAVYKKSDIYLLDDCLSALDGEVNKHIFRECIRGFLKDKICILVTNNINNIKYVPIESVLTLEDGRTLDLDQQKEALDKRITYYIDEDGTYVVEDSDPEADSNYEKAAGESDQLLKKEATEPRRNLYHEEPQTGKVLFRNYMSYYKYAGGIWVLVLVLILFLISQISLSFSDKFVSVWANTVSNLTILKERNQTDIKEYDILSTKKQTILNLYTFVILLSFLLMLIRACANFYFCTRAGRNLHRVLAAGIMNCYMTFFDNRFVGNIVNRVAKDFHTIDENIPFIIYENLKALFLIPAKIILIASTNVLFLIPAAGLFGILYLIQKFYIPTGRSLRRLEAACRSPMVGYVNASLEGVSVVRACEQEKILEHEFDRHQDVYTSVYHTDISVSRWFAFSMDLICVLFMSTVVLTFAVSPKGVLGGEVGLAVSQAMLLTGLLQFAIRQASELENTMTSVERVLEYSEVPIERKVGQMFKDWPRKGTIKYRNVNLTYHSTGEVALKYINFEIQGRSKIGIVGRTGAGKTSIISALFRLYDYQGQIFIDGEDITKLNLEFLRSKIGIIPQDPILFSGTIRTNIDPLKIYSDTDIWDAIEKVQMKGSIWNLDQPILDHGSNFSSGQRQLLCLARALVSKNKIIVLDEATANMDPETDRMLQKIIKENFADCTLLTIAHRLNTFTEADKILVIEDGKVVEFDEPLVLLNRNDSTFHRMVAESGGEMFL